MADETPTMPVLPEHDPSNLLTPAQRAWLTESIFIDPHAGEPIRFASTTEPAPYIPTTDEIREYVEVGGEYRPWESPTPAADEKRVAAFDRWLSAHDAQVWDEGYAAGWDDGYPQTSTNPYRP